LTIIPILSTASSAFAPAFSPVTFAFGLLPMIDTELLLLRAAGFLLAFTFGIQKIGWYVTAFHAGKPLSSIGLAPLIAHVGFPLPVILALWIMLNESIAAFFIGLGFYRGSQRPASPWE